MTATASPITRSSSPLPLSPPANLRDLGGITIHGGRTRPGFAWRADDLSMVDDASARRLVDDGLTTIIDLRSLAEIEITGRGLLGSHRIAYHHIPFMASISEAAEHSPSGADMWDQSRFARMYIHLFENAAPQIVSSLAIIAHSPGASVFHCAAGQDRTGVLAAALLLSLGAAPEDIVTDYAKTGANIAAVSLRVRPVIEPMMARLGMRTDAAARAATRTEYSHEPMLGLLRHLDAAYADPLQPLIDAGLTPGLREQLQRKALTE